VATEFDWRIANIPCIIRVESVRGQKPLGPSAESDWDCYGWTDVEFEVLNRKGYKALWLEKKLTLEETREIEAEAVRLAEEAYQSSLEP